MALQKHNYEVLWEKFIKEGDKDSLAKIYMEQYDLLFNYGYKLSKDTALIEDTIQNCFGYFLKKRETLTPINNFQAYMEIGIHFKDEKYIFKDNTFTVCFLLCSNCRGTRQAECGNNSG